MVEKNATNILEIPTETHTAAPDLAADDVTFPPPPIGDDPAETEMRGCAGAADVAGTVGKSPAVATETPEVTSVTAVVRPLTAPVRRRGFRYGCYLVVKRLFDIVSSFAALLLLSPVILIALLAKFLEDGHSPIYV